MIQSVVDNVDVNNSTAYAKPAAPKKQANPLDVIMESAMDDF